MSNNTMYELRQYLYSKQLRELKSQGMSSAQAISLLDSKFEKDMELKQDQLVQVVDVKEHKESNAERIKSYIERFVEPNMDIVMLDEEAEVLN